MQRHVLSLLLLIRRERVYASWTPKQETGQGKKDDSGDLEHII